MHSTLARLILLGPPLLALAVQGPDDPARRAMIAALAANGPHPALGTEGELFDSFVGTWDVDYATLTPTGTWQRFKGELHFGWILDGYALQDVWTSYGAAGGRTSGTTIRFYDPARKSWRVTFIAPTFQAVVQLEGGTEGGNIVLRGMDPDGSLLRWSFRDIHADSFTWWGERSRDGGATWRLEEENKMRRRAEER